MIRHSIISLIVLVLTANSVPSNASSWPHDPTVNVPLTVAPGAQQPQLSVSDGAGGAIVAWGDLRGADIDVYAQRVDADGNVVWTVDGVAVCTAIGDQRQLQLVTDGEGGAIVVWHDGRNNAAQDVYAQRIDSAGSVLWAVDGVMVDGPFMSVAAGSSAELRRSSDGGRAWAGEFNNSGQDLYASSILDIYTGMVAGAGGTIMMTTDGGTSWSMQPSGVAVTLHDIEMRDSFTAMAVGGSGRILTWNGSFWSAISPIVPETLRGVSYASGQTAVAVGDTGRILRTTNGGTNWNTQSSGTSAALYQVDFATNSVGVAVGDAGTIRRTSDGGAFWTSQTSGTAQALHGVAFVDANTGFAVGAAGTILGTTDSGVSWNAVTSPTIEALFDVSFSDSAYGVAVGANGAVVVTMDGGVTWSLGTSGVGTVLHGVSMAHSFTDQLYPKAVSDDAGGVIIAWEDERNGTIDVYAQRLDANGNRVFLHDTPVATGIDDQREMAVTTNGDSGAYIAWENYTGFSADSDVFVQGVDGGGGLMFGTALTLSVAVSRQNHVAGAYIGDGLAMFAWEDNRLGSPDISAQVVHPGGFSGWVLNGIEVCSEVGSQFDVRVIADGSGAAIMAWVDARQGSYVDIYAQRVQNFVTNQVAWGTGGVRIDSAPGDSYDFEMVSDGLGGAIIAWFDVRNLSSVFASAIDADGILRWEPDGVPVSTAPLAQVNPQVVSDGANGVIVVWIDDRNESVPNTNADVYAQNIDRHGYLGDAGPSITTVTDVPNDQGGVATVSWNASYADVFPEQVITEYSVWRRNEAIASATVLPSSPTDETTRALEHALAAGVSRPLAEAMAVGGWVFLNTSPVAYLTEYGYDAPTYGDSTGAGVPLTGFRVIAHTADPFVFWISDPASGFSIDNLAPATAISLMAQQKAVDIELNWSPSGVNESDFSHYAIYRSNSPGVVPGPSTFLTTTPDTSQTDSSPGPGTYFYVVTSVDVNENESEPSNEASAAIVTGVRNVPSITPDRLTLTPSYPNPFNDATTLRFGVPAADDVTIEVFDVAGRRVFEDRVRISAGGWYTYSISARTSSGTRLPSGVYMYRISTAQYVRSSKFIVTR